MVERRGNLGMDDRDGLGAYVVMGVEWEACTSCDNKLFSLETCREIERARALRVTASGQRGD